EISPSEPQAIDLFDPATNQVRLAAKGGVWAPVSALRDHAETTEESQARRQAQATLAREEARQEGEARETNRREARQAARSAESDRRAYARQLRENYLSLGTNIKVTISGAHAERITLEYALI